MRHPDPHRADRGAHRPAGHLAQVEGAVHVPRGRGGVAAHEHDLGETEFDGRAAQRVGLLLDCFPGVADDGEPVVDELCHQEMAAQGAGGTPGELPGPCSAAWRQTAIRLEFSARSQAEACAVSANSDALYRALNEV